jgi:isoquinoline 1-oxidoreductase
MGPEESKRRRPEEEGITRREFLRFAGGVVVVFSLAPGALGQQVGERAVSVEALDPAAWLRIGPDNRVTVFAGAVEVGQGIRTALVQMVAEELTVPLAAVDLVLGETDRAPFLPESRGNAAIPTYGVRLRAAAAEARQIAVRLAAETWGVSPERVAVRDGRVVLASDPAVSLPLGEVAQGGLVVRELGDQAPLTSASEYRLVGTSAPQVEGRAIVTGEARFAADLRLPGLAYGKVLRAPCLGARLVEVNTTGAAGQPGVIAAVQQGDFVGLVATKPDLAEKAIRHIQATWEETDHPSATALHQNLRSSASLEEPVHQRGDVQAALATARRGFSASYRTAFVAHAPLEPHAAVAWVQGDNVTLYASTQRPFEHRSAVAEALGLPTARVHVMTPPVGGAFGGKDAADVSVEAARLSRAVARPVLVTQTRREELTWNYFGAAAVVDVRCGLGPDGRMAAWDCDVYNLGSRAAAPPYAVPNQRVRSYRCQPVLRQGPWRGLEEAVSNFAREAHVDHVASAMGWDPIEFRLRHLEADSRMAAVIRAAAERCGWRTRRPPTGLGVGFACAEYAGTYVAEIAEVEVGRLTGEVRVRRLTVAHDSGLVVSPDGVRNQIEGAVVMGLGLALREEVRYEQGRILTESFTSYPIPTMRDAPVIDTVLTPGAGHPPGGAGVAALVPVAAAVSNALFDATGKRIRELPLSPNRVLAALRS